MTACSWCGADLVEVVNGAVQAHKVVEADANLCPGSGKPPHLRRPSISTVNVTKDLLHAMRQTECPRCGYRYKATRRTRRYELATREALAVAALAFHALEVHGQTIGSLQAEAAR